MMVLWTIALSFWVLLFPNIEKTSAALRVHLKTQSQCDTRVLELTKILAQNLQLLGELNPLCRKTILARRQIDKLIVAGTVAPEALPALLQKRSQLVLMQKGLALKQKSIFVNTAAHIRKVTTPRFTIGPSHSIENVLHVTKEMDFESEVGAPYEIDSDFSKNQSATGKISFTDAFQKTVNVQCKAQVVMTSLESPWETRLVL